MLQKADSSDGRSRLARVLTWTVLGSVGLALVLVAGAWLLLRASLPRTDGSVALSGLSAQVEMSRDSLGVPVIRAGTLTDAIRGLGFVHAQDRFFQMDLYRRRAAGELAGLFGRAALPSDRRNRTLGLRERARRHLDSLPVRDRKWIDAYTAGVNAGLADLGARPPEYLLLRVAPERWRPEDCVLTWMAASLNLDRSGPERTTGVMRATLPRKLVAFLVPPMTRFDVPMVVSEEEPNGGYRPLPIPGPEVVDLRERGHGTNSGNGLMTLQNDALTPGSNAWAVDSSLTEDEGALLAGDPHGRLGVPSAFYRFELHWANRSAYGASFPGFPGMLHGATGDLAVGMVNGHTDQTDRIFVEVDETDSTRYRTPTGPEPFGSRQEVVAVRGEEDVTLDVRTTRWGPVVDTDWKGRPLVVKRAAMSPVPVVGGLIDVLTASSVPEGLDVLTNLGAVSLGFVVADAAGRVGWTLSGPHPRRTGFDGSVPTSWAETGTGWEGLVTDSERPVIADSGRARVFHANNRPVGIDLFEEIRFLPSNTGVRAHRIRTLLDSRDVFDEAAFHEMQLDLRTPYFDYARDIVLEVVAPDDSNTLLRRVRGHVADWDGTAATDQVGFRLLTVYNEALLRRVLGALLAPADSAAPSSGPPWSKAREAFLRILEERPAHLVPPGYETWREFLRSTLENSMSEIQTDPERPDINASWGEVNRLDYRHPLGGLPLLGDLLNMERTPISGGAMALKAQAPAGGQMLRLVVNPAHPERATLHLPVGQSGHFLSPHYDDFQSSWIAGETRPLVAGPPESSFKLLPNE